MRRKKSITVKTQQDLEAACKRMEDRERAMLDDFDDEVIDGEYQERESAHKYLNGVDDSW